MHRRNRILVVEDEPDIRESLKDLIEMQIPDCDVTLAKTGSDALAMLDTVRPDVLLTDYKMPGMNGLDLLAALRKEMPTTPGLLMTAYPDISMTGRSVDARDVKEIVAKPIEPDLLRDALLRALDGRED